MQVSVRSVNLLFIVGFFLALILIEVWLRMNGTRPGFIYQGVNEVDSLTLSPCYYTDANGIQKLTPYAISLVHSYVQHKRELSPSKIEIDKIDNDIATLAYDFYCLEQKLTVKDIDSLLTIFGIERDNEERNEFKLAYNQSEFRTKLVSIQQTHANSAFDSVLLEYIASPVNSSGFHSIEFCKRVSGKKRVLLLGDSHTWGRNGTPYFNSFADILLSRGYLVYNTGIVCADPVQYAAILNTYVDSVQPDIVVLNFFINDKIPCEHLPTETYHHTNAGLISAYPNNSYMDAKHAYEFELEASKIPRTTLLNRIFSTTAITTRIWCTMHARGILSSENPLTKKYELLKTPDKVHPASHKYLAQVFSLCKQRNISCITSAIPNIYTYSDRYPQVGFEQVFDTIPFFEITTLTSDDYSTDPSDDHLNNSGHKKYADFLQHLIDSVERTLP